MNVYIKSSAHEDVPDGREVLWYYQMHSDTCFKATKTVYEENKQKIKERTNKGQALTGTDGMRMDDCLIIP
uniref:Uncharacterized protein n=1 Tax=Romanomermis culicivorax TaxID=13658 RepID=A0A915K1Q8_ROMCU